MPTAAGVPHIVTKYGSTDLTPYVYHVAAGNPAAGAEFVQLATSPATTAPYAPMGVIQTFRNAVAGASVGIGVEGPSKVIAGATVDEGTFLTCNASGRAVEATSGQWTFGRAMRAAVVGDYFEAWLFPPTIYVGPAQ